MAGILRNFQLALKNVFLKIKKDVYYFYMNLNMSGKFQISISVPLSCVNGLFHTSIKDYYE